jgi:hypothetical protein
MFSGSLRHLVSLTAVLAPLAAAAAQRTPRTEFSADLVSTGGKGQAGRMKIYAGRNAVRFESEDAKTGGRGVFIMSGARHTTAILVPEQKLYFESTSDAGDDKGMGGLSFFRPINPNDPCAEFRKQMVNCKKVGSETVNGRSTQRWDGKSAKTGQAGSLWVDPKLGLVVKFQSAKDGVAELQNIKEGAQPAGLFEIPAGYQKMNVGATPPGKPRKR